MNIIIELILKIFQLIFEKDAAERQKNKPQSKLGQQPPGPQPTLKDSESLLAEFFRELKGFETLPQPKARPVRVTPPPIPKPARRETLVEHLEQQERERERVAQRARGIAAHADAIAGVKKKKAARSHQTDLQEVLPGKSPLEQMIIAGVILGPCKAHDRRRIL